MKEELKKGLYNKQKRKPLAKAYALFYKGVKEVKDQSMIHVVHGTIQICSFVDSAIAAKYTLQGEGLAGWNVKSEQYRIQRTPFFQAVVNSV